MRWSRGALRLSGLAVGLGAGCFCFVEGFHHLPRAGLGLGARGVVMCDSSRVARYSVSTSGKVEPADSRYERVDQKLKSEPKFRRFIKNHAVHETLAGPGMIEQYEMFINKETEELLAVITFGKSLNGYPGIVHGGILGLLIDNSYGILFVNLDKPYAFTANLNINYRNPT